MSIIRELNLPSPQCISPLRSADDALRLLCEGDLRHLLVTDRGELSGVVSDADLIEAIGMLSRHEREALPGGAEDVIVADVMDTDFPSISLDASVAEAAHLLVDEKRTALPVIHVGAPVAILSEMDVIRFLTAGAPRSSPVHAEAVLNHGKRVARTLKPWETLDRLYTRLRGGRIRHIPVLERDRLVGTVCDADLRRAAQDSTDGKWAERTVADVMRPGIRPLRPNDSLARAAELMRVHNVTALPITTRDRLLVSMLTATDLLAALVEAQRVAI